jgi:hypothetical protein
MEQNRKFNLDDYETVEVRLEKYWAKFVDGKVLTEMEKAPEGQFIMRAAIYAHRNDTDPIATGYAHEIVGQGMVNRTSALENCETSAIGRALANAGFATTGKRASREEMSKVVRADQTKAPRAKRPDDAASTGNLGLVLVRIAETNTSDELKEIWNEFRDALDVDIKGTTIRNAIMQRKDEVQS